MDDEKEIQDKEFFRKISTETFDHDGVTYIKELIHMFSLMGFKPKVAVHNALAVAMHKHEEVSLTGLGD